MALCVVLDAPTFVSGFMRMLAEQPGFHFGIAENAGPFAKGQVEVGDFGRVFEEPANQVEQELAALQGSV